MGYVAAAAAAREVARAAMAAPVVGGWARRQRWRRGRRVHARDAHISNGGFAPAICAQVLKCQAVALSTRQLHIYCSPPHVTL